MEHFLPEKIKCAAIVSPAGKPDQAELEQGIFFLKKCGIQVKVMPHAFGSKNTTFPYLAATDQERAADFTEAYLDKDVDIIFASRGGYGCGRILPLLNWEKLKKAPPKIVAGYSDLTSLFFAMTAKNCGTPLASIMAAKLWSCGQRELLGIFDACSKTKKIFTLDVIKAGNANGTILAGNLTVAASCIGTEYMPDVQNKILVLEEIGEDPYRIDRLFNQLKLSGTLSRCAGIIAGHFTGCPDDILKEILTDYSRHINGPVLADYAYGHEMPFDSLLYGTPAIISDNTFTVNAE